MVKNHEFSPQSKTLKPLHSKIAKKIGLPYFLSHAILLQKMYHPNANTISILLSLLFGMQLPNDQTILSKTNKPPSINGFTAIAA